MSAEPAPRPLAFPAAPIPAKASLRRPVTLPEYLPARMLNEFVYCPRLFFYEWVESVFCHSSDTVDGAQKHEKADAREDGLPAAEDLADVTFRARAVTLSSDTHRLGMIKVGDDVAVRAFDFRVRNRRPPRDPEVQARLLARYLEGEIPSYPGCEPR